MYNLICLDFMRKLHLRHKNEHGIIKKVNHDNFCLYVLQCEKMTIIGLSEPIQLTLYLLECEFDMNSEIDKSELMKALNRAVVLKRTITFDYEYRKIRIL